MIEEARAEGPTRTCVGCGRRDRQSAMLRLRRDPAGSIGLAEAGKAGRSAYVHAAADCVNGIVRSKGLGRSLRTVVEKDERRELVRRLEAGFNGAPVRRRDGEHRED